MADSAADGRQIRLAYSACSRETPARRLSRQDPVEAFWKVHGSVVSAGCRWQYDACGLSAGETRRATDVLRGSNDRRRCTDPASAASKLEISMKSLIWVGVVSVTAATGCGERGPTVSATPPPAFVRSAEEPTTLAAAVPQGPAGATFLEVLPSASRAKERIVAEAAKADASGRRAFVDARRSERKPPEQIASARTPGAPRAAAVGQEPGKIFGQITYDGKPPKLPPVVDASRIRPAEAHVCKPELIGNESLVVNHDNRGIQFVFVYMEKSPANAPKRDLLPIVFDSKDCRFMPRGLFVQTGQTVNVTNSDPFNHCVHTYPIRNARFNNVCQPGKPPTPLVYQKPEKLPVEVRCDCQTWMKGYHLVLDHPWGAVTDADGKFELPQLPAGKYDLKVWHEMAGYLARSIEVEVDGDTELSLKFAPTKFARPGDPRSE
ncbi:MAG TPA: hypothetical protein VML55_07545 [Planctomycetaceae bacterium]|nr:hypothetical protein [Planctomycetaceae bacterium]